MTVSMNVHHVTEVTIKRSILYSGVYTTDIEISDDSGYPVFEITLFSKEPLKIEEN